MADKLLIPMIILANHIKTPIQVPAVNPNYKLALQSYLGKDGTPAAFNTNIMLKKGMHLHFILPSAMKKGYETLDEKNGSGMEYPAVPDRYIVTRMYVKDGRICTDCNIIESNFYSLDSTYRDSITIPKFDDLRPRHRFRYMGRTYPAKNLVPEAVGECGYFDRITAIGAGDPMFSAYYPSCSSVFGYYDNLEGVPEDAVLTYFVLGYYSNADNDILHGVNTQEDMKRVLEKYNFSVEQDCITLCRESILFGEISGIDLTQKDPVPLGEIDIGIGKSSAEALSAVIKDQHYEKKPGMERLLTSIQYDTADEYRQPDGNFKIDDDIHYRGFSRMDPLEKEYVLKLPKDRKEEDEYAIKEPYHNLCLLELEIGKRRRLLEYKKNNLYYFWEMYMDASCDNKEKIKKIMDSLVQEITGLREVILQKMQQKNPLIEFLKIELAKINGSLEETSQEAFYLPKDPAVVLCGDGMKRTYAFGEEGRFEENNTLYCLCKPLTGDFEKEKLLGYFEDFSAFKNIIEDYTEYAVLALLLDKGNLQAKLQIVPHVKEKFSPVMCNDNPMEEITLFMQWESAFYPNYLSAEYNKSSFEYEDTEYVYHGEVTDYEIRNSGISLLTPHGVYNLGDKIEKYLEYHMDEEEESVGKKERKRITENIKDIAAVSQNLGGFTIGLNALEYAFQYPITIDPQDEYSKKIAESISPSIMQFEEPRAERLAVRNNMPVIPLREGSFTISRLALVSTFGKQRKILDDELEFKGKRYVSESLSDQNGKCFFPLGLTSAGRLKIEFVSAQDENVKESVFLDTSPIIGIFLPDMLNRNLNIFSSEGEFLGILKTAYRSVNGKKAAVGRFIKTPGSIEIADERIKEFIEALTKDNTAFAEVMEVIDQKLNKTLTQSTAIFGRALVLAEVVCELEYMGGTEWSKEESAIGQYDDKGLWEQAFPIYFGDKNREMDGVCCSFYNKFTSGTAAYGMQKENAEYLNAQPFYISAAEGKKKVTLLFDPMLNVTVNTGIFPVKQIRIMSEHIDFSQFHLMAAELHTVISQKEQASLPQFVSNTDFVRCYPKMEDRSVQYQNMKIDNTGLAINFDEKTMITDGMVIEWSEENERN